MTANFIINTGNEDKRLIKLEHLCASLNHPDYASSNINSNFLMTDSTKMEGTFIEVESGNFGVFLGHEFNPFIYRGENKDYKEFIPSSKRFKLKNKTNCDEERLRHCVEWINKKDFIEFFKETPYYKRCSEFEVLGCKFKFDLNALAQHYEFVTDYIDISRDMAVAMFFAYTYIHDGKYYPITDFKKYKPTLYIANLADIFKKDESILKIIGFQSALRPFIQKAMALDMNASNGIKKLFNKIKLPQSAEIANGIFEHFKQGATIFPNDFLGSCASGIKAQKTLPVPYLKEYCELFKQDRKYIEKLINESSYTLTDKIAGYSEEQFIGMNLEIDNYIIPFLNNRISFRAYSKHIEF